MGRRSRPGTKGELMSNERFSAGAETALRYAQQAAGELGHDYVGTEHLLLGLMISSSTDLGQEALEGWRSIRLIHGAPASQLIKYL